VEQQVFQRGQRRPSWGAVVGGRGAEDCVGGGSGQAGQKVAASHRVLTFLDDRLRPSGNLVDLQRKVRETGADIGLAFDGDADRCFFIDERGQAVSPSGLVAAGEPAKDPGSALVHNVITSAAAVEIIREHGGTPIRSRVGHSFMKALMGEHDAVFGGEHSGHYYFRDFWRADTGMLTALHVLAALGEQERPLSDLVADYSRYAASGEINSQVADVPTKLDEVEAAYRQFDGAIADRLDGLTVNLGGGRWFNLRPSNTEPLLRLNVEAPTLQAVDAVRDGVLALVRS
jgi:phosphomannomutase